MVETMKTKERDDSKESYPLDQIYFYLTEGCNLACRHCWLSPKLQTKNNIYPSISVEVFNSILEQAVPLGLKTVKLTGGEPLMHPKIKKLLRIIRNREISMTIETNGVLCTPEIAAEIANVKKTSVSVSLDGVDAKTHEWSRGINGSFDATINGIKNLVNTGIKPQVIFTLMKHNRDQIADIVRLAESLGAKSVKFNLVQPTGRGKKMNEEGESLNLEDYLKMGEFINNTLSSSTELKLFYDLPAAFRPLSKMYGKKGDGCAACAILNIIGVLANGNYALCGIGEHIPELVFGCASTDRLENIWKNNEVLLALREGIPSRLEGICSRCHMKRICSASCIAQNYYLSKSLWSSYWFCDEAYRKGLFPKTRILPQTNNRN